MPGSDAVAAEFQYIEPMVPPAAAPADADPMKTVDCSWISNPPAKAAPPCAVTAARLILKRRNALFILIEVCIRELPAGDSSSFPTIATITAPRLRHIRHSNNNVGIEVRTLAAVLLGQQKTGPPKRAGSCQAQFQSLETSLGAPPGVLKRRMDHRNRGQADSVPPGAQVLTLYMLRESLKFDACSQHTMRC